MGAGTHSTSVTLASKRASDRCGQTRATARARTQKESECRRSGPSLSAPIPLARRVPAACKRPTHRSAAVRQPPPLHPLAAPASRPCPPPAAPRWQRRRPFHPPSAAHARDGARALLLSPLPPSSSALVPPRRPPRLDLFPHPFSSAARQAEIARHAVRARRVAPAAASGHTSRAACGARSAPRGKEKSDRQNSTLPDKSRKNVGNVRSARIVRKATMEVPSATTSGDACSVEEGQRGDDEEGVVAHFNTGAAAAQAAGSAAAVNSRVDTFARSLARACERATQARRGRRPLPATRRGSLTLVAAHPL